MNQYPISEELVCPYCKSKKKQITRISRKNEPNMQILRVSFTCADCLSRACIESEQPIYRIKKEDLLDDC